jgi:hypothetical protein
MCLEMMVAEEEEVEEECVRPKIPLYSFPKEL